MSIPLRISARIATAFLPLLVLASGVTAAAQESVQIDASLVTIQQGDIPIVLSTPHGGRKRILDVPERKGDGAQEFVAVRDENTAELTEKLAAEIERRLHGKSFVVIARFERKYLDVNRPAEDAFETEAARAHYRAYHQALEKSCRDVRSRWQNGLLLDIHGQAAEPDKIMRGTANGDTVTSLVKRHSRVAVIGPRSIFGGLAERGYGVLPKLDTDDREVKFTGGHIVRTYGSHREQGLDAIQIEIGSNFRTKSRLDRTASDLATSIHEFCTTYLPDAVRREPARP
jgi:N-formylglutamate amidohydrolase